jgi:serine/threonine protein kinase
LSSYFPPNAVHIVKSFGNRQPINFRRKYPGTDEDGYHLLKAMLTFNPSKRITIEDALRHPYLSCEQSDRREREAICLDPMRADIEQISEDPDNLVANVS